MNIALTHASEHYAALSRLTPLLTGEIGLIFSPQEPEQLLPILHTFRPASFARTGNPASRTFTLPAGTLYTRGGEIPIEDDVPVQHSMEPGFRKLGLPTKMNKGKVVLEDEFTVCREGEILGSGQASLLKAFGVVTAEFRVIPVAMWQKEKDKVMVLEQEAADASMEIDMEGIEAET